MDLEVSQRSEGSVIVVEPRGEIDVWTAERLRTALHEAEGSDASSIVVDLTGVGFLDSTGIGVLVGALRRQKERERELRLVVSHPHVLKVLTITSLDKVFAIDETIDAALTSAHKTSA